ESLSAPTVFARSSGRKDRNGAPANLQLIFSHPASLVRSTTMSRPGGPVHQNAGLLGSKGGGRPSEKGQRHWKR
ncbi:unnamed protein product, partial [Effrenium voratum]